MWENEYQRILLEARTKYTRDLSAAMLRELHREYAAMIVRMFEEVATRDFGSNAARARAKARVKALALDMRRHMDLYQIRLETLYGQAEQATIAAAAEAHNRAIAAATELVDVQVRGSATIALAPSRVIETMMQRRALGLSENFKTLLNRNLRAAAADVDRFLSSSIGRGVAPDRAAKELATILARDDEAVKAALKSLGPRAGRTRAVIAEGVEIPPDVLRRARAALTDSRRIMVSEIQNTFFEADRQASVESPMVDLVKWTLSGRHAGLPTSPDICDYYATADLHGYGPGLFHPASVPPPPHPNDQCQMTPVLRSPREWDKEKRPIPEPRGVTLNQFRKEMQELGRGTSLERRMKPEFKYVENQFKMLSGVGRAHNVAVGSING